MAILDLVPGWALTVWLIAANRSSLAFVLDLVLNGMGSRFVRVLSFNRESVRFGVQLTVTTRDYSFVGKVGNR